MLEDTNSLDAAHIVTCRNDEVWLKEELDAYKLWILFKSYFLPGNSLAFILSCLFVISKHESEFLKQVRNMGLRRLPRQVTEKFP